MMAAAIEKANAFDPYETNQHDLAQAALTALQDYMPIIDPTTVDDLALYYQESQLWSELKTLGREDDRV